MYEKIIAYEKRFRFLLHSREAFHTKHYDFYARLTSRKNVSIHKNVSEVFRFLLSFSLSFLDRFSSCLIPFSL